jgi:outer membrane protein assembly factor BamB
VTWEYPARGVPASAPRDAKESRGGGPGLEAGPTRIEGIAIGESGALALSAPLREFYPGGSKVTPPPILWTGLLDSLGNLLVGAGNTGEVIRIDPKGTATGYARTEELGVRALAGGARGDLFMATFPSGGVYRITAAGVAEPYFDPEDRYIWAMAVDQAGQLFVATGERGILYKVTGGQEGKPFFDSDETHITSLAFDASGRLLAGTSPGGLLYRLSTDGRAELLLDTELGEISAVTVTPEGTIYAAAIGEEAIQPPRRPGEKSDLTIEVTPAGDGSALEEQTDVPRKITIDLSELVPSLAGMVTGTAGRLYRIDPDRSPVLVWKSDSERIYALAWSAGRGLVFGTGGLSAEGRVYRLEPDQTVTLLHRLREAQVTALLAHSSGRIYVCASNPGRVYLLDTGATSTGSYLSSIHDAGHRARWGAIAWSAETPPGTRLELSTRSGNRPDPDESWSEWSPPYAAEGGSPVVSPPGRFIQWKAELSRLKTELSPVLRHVKVTLLPENRPPTVRNVSVLAPGASATEPRAPKAPTQATEGSGPERSADRGAEKDQADKEPAGKGEPPKGSRWVSWTSADPDADTLACTIWLKSSPASGAGAPQAGSAQFTRLAFGVLSSPWALDDSGLAEGVYVLKVEADDAAINGLELSLRDSGASDPFLVDHTAPRLETRRPPGQKEGEGRLVLEVTATDGLSPIARGEYSVDAASGPWILLPCRDGICDTSVESFRLDVARPGPGARITLRVTDAAGNAATVEAP